MFNINFEQKSPQVICHKDYEKLIPTILENLKPYELHDHFILFSSGTTGGDLKGYALSREALFKNAEAVNNHFGLQSRDIWGLSLPIYHVGGLSVLARAYLTNSKIVDGRSWEPQLWSKKMAGVSITTVVPTQLYDLVQRKIRPSSSLRYLVVGGDYLSSALKEEALNLGWPVIRTYGMSEVCSQLASTKDPQSDDLEILPIHEVKIKEKRLLVKSSALFTLEFSMGTEFKVTLGKELCDQEGFYLTKDLAQMEGNVIRPLGRIGEEAKIAGHLINLNQLRDTLASYLFRKNLFQKMELVLEEDERKGKKLVLFVLSDAHSQFQLEEISNLLRPVKIDEVKFVQQFQRTALGKLKKT